MDVDAVAKTILAFTRRHRQVLTVLGGRQSQVLELAALVGVSHHYKAAGFSVAVENPRGGREFVVKSGTRGHPADYSRLRCTKGRDEVELHANLMVQSARDDGTYCVDVGIVRASRVPSSKGGKKWTRLANKDLRSFAEVKKLVVYPMLLAQFVGIVHEIRPNFLRKPRPRGFGALGHLPPTLIALGHYSSNSEIIVKAFRSRGFSFLVTASYDVRLTKCRFSPFQSPFYLADAPSEARAV